MGTISNYRDSIIRGVTRISLWTPAYLFEDGEGGFYWDFSDPANVGDVGIGDPVTTITDKSGNGEDGSQAVVAEKMVFARVPFRKRVNELNSTDTLATQNVTVTAAERVLSFWGTGTITLSGTSTAGPLVGVDANTRVDLTFTPTAGTLTLTVSGSVNNAQLEVAA